MPWRRRRPRGRPRRLSLVPAIFLVASLSSAAAVVEVVSVEAAFAVVDPAVFRSSSSSPPLLRRFRCADRDSQPPDCRRHPPPRTSEDAKARRDSYRDGPPVRIRRGDGGDAAASEDNRDHRRGDAAAGAFGTRTVSDLRRRRALFSVSSSLLLALTSGTEKAAAAEAEAAATRRAVPVDARPSSPSPRAPRTKGGSGSSYGYGATLPTGPSNFDVGRIASVHDPRLRGFRFEDPSSVGVGWTGTALPGPLSLSEMATVTAAGTFPMGRWPDPALRRPASAVPPSAFRDDRSRFDLQIVAEALRNTARREGAVGLAAQQCGIDASLVFLDKSGADQQPWSRFFGESGSESSAVGGWGEGNGRRGVAAGEGKGIFLVNPRIVRRSPESEMRVWTERCLVLPPDFRATLLRDAEVDVEYETLRGETRQIALGGELARCAQHEIDHDLGVLITDHVSLEEISASAMARIEDSDGRHGERMAEAYARGIASSSSLLAAGFEGQGGGRKWSPIPPAYASEGTPRESTNISGTIRGGGGRPRAEVASAATTVPPATAQCDELCLEERKRIVRERRAMMEQSRSNTNRGDVLELSQQRAAMYGTEFRGAPCPGGFCP